MDVEKGRRTGKAFGAEYLFFERLGNNWVVLRLLFLRHISHRAFQSYINIYSRRFETIDFVDVS